MFQRTWETTSIISVKSKNVWLWGILLQNDQGNCFHHAVVVCYVDILIRTPTSHRNLFSPNDSRSNITWILILNVTMKVFVASVTLDKSLLSVMCMFSGQICFFVLGVTICGLYSSCKTKTNFIHDTWVKHSGQIRVFYSCVEPYDCSVASSTNYPVHLVCSKCNQSFTSAGVLIFTWIALDVLILLTWLSWRTI